MSSDAQVLLWIAGVHLLGLGCVAILLIPALRDAPATPKRQSDGEGDDGGWGRGPKLPPTPPAPPRGGIPLSDAEQSRVRLREPGGRPVRTPNRARNASGSRRCYGSGR